MVSAAFTTTSMILAAAWLLSGSGSGEVTCADVDCECNTHEYIKNPDFVHTYEEYFQGEGYYTRPSYWEFEDYTTGHNHCNSLAITGLNSDYNPDDYSGNVARSSWETNDRGNNEIILEQDDVDLSVGDILCHDITHRGSSHPWRANHKVYIDGEEVKNCGHVAVGETKTCKVDISSYSGNKHTLKLTWEQYTDDNIGGSGKAHLRILNCDKCGPSKSPTPTSTKTLSAIRTPTASSTRTHTPTSTHTSTATRTQTGTGTLTPTRSSSSTATRTETPTASVSPTLSMTQTLSSTARRTSTATETCTSTLTMTSSPSKSQTQTSTGFPSSSISASSSCSETASQSSSHTSTPSGTCSPSQTITATMSMTSSPSETSSATQSETSSVTPSNDENADDGSHGSGSSSEIEQDSIELAGALLGGFIVITLLFYVGYKRLQNKTKHHQNAEDLAQCYAIHFGIKEVESSAETIGMGGDEQKEPHIAAQMKAHSPLVQVRTNVVSGGRTEECPSASSITESANYSQNLPFELVEIKGIEPSKRGQVKIISSKEPNLESIRSQSNTGARTQLALIKDIDTSNMGRIQRTTLKLRQWKAKMLAEPHPVVEVEIPDEIHPQKARRFGDVDHERSASLASRFHFANAKHRPKKRRSLIMNEVYEHTSTRRVTLVRSQRRKKTFAALPPPSTTTTGKESKIRAKKSTA